MAPAFDLPADFFAHLAWRRLRFDGKDRFLGGGAGSHGGAAYSYDGSREENLCVNLVLRGRGLYIDHERRRHELVPGALFHRLPTSAHQTTVDPGSDYAELFLYCDGATGSGLVASGQIIATPVIMVGVDALMVESYLALLKRIAQPEAQVPSRRALLETVGFINGLYDRAHRNRVLGFWDRVIEQACLALERDLESRAPVARVAARLGVSYRAFRKHFRAATGHAPADYRIRRRLEAAQLALMTRSVTDTARDLGYEDLYAFSAQFRKFVGIPPRRFQQRTRERPSFVPLARPWQAAGQPGPGREG